MLDAADREVAGPAGQPHEIARLDQARRFVAAPDLQLASRDHRNVGGAGARLQPFGSGAQWAMILSGAQSMLAGAFHFLVSAVWMKVSSARRASVEETA